MLPIQVESQAPVPPQANHLTQVRGKDALHIDALTYNSSIVGLAAQQVDRPDLIRSPKRADSHLGGLLKNGMPSQKLEEL